MKILILTNFYPPFELGGQEKSCKQVVEGLRSRGHEIAVLTSRHGVDGRFDEDPRIFRKLNLEMELVPLRNSLSFFTQRKQAEAENLSVFRQKVVSTRPDVIFIWGMWNLHRSLPFQAEADCPGRVVYRFAEYWPTLPSQYDLYWRAPGRTPLTRFSKKLLGSLALSLLEDDLYTSRLRFEHCICVSEGTRNHLVESGVPVQDARIIYTGLDTGMYPKYKKQVPQTRGRLRLLYAGRLAREKGIETLIEAVKSIQTSAPEMPVTLDIAGGGDADYVESLKKMVLREDLSDWIHFLGKLPSESMPDLFPEYDVLVLPSNWPEPFARVVLEGMITGLVVVATPLGGTSEILKDGQNGLLFQPGNGQDLARKLLVLLNDPDLCQTFSQNGRSTVLEYFSKQKMLDEVEAYLTQVVNQAEVSTAISG